MASSPNKDSALWYLEIGGTRLGPYSPLAIRALFEKNEITAKDTVRPASASSTHEGGTMTVGEFLQSGIDFSPVNSISLKHVTETPPPHALTNSSLHDAAEPTRVLTNPGGAYELLNVLQTYRHQQQGTNNAPKGRAPSQPSVAVRGVPPRETASSSSSPWTMGLGALGVSAAIGWAVFNYSGMISSGPKTGDAPAAEVAHTAPTTAKEEPPKPSTPAPNRRRLATGTSATAPTTSASLTRLQRLKERERVAAAAAAESSRDRDRDQDDRERDRDRDRDRDRERDREPANEGGEASDVHGRGEASDRAAVSETSGGRPFDGGVRPPNLNSAAPEEGGNDRQPDSVPAAVPGEPAQQPGQAAEGGQAAGAPQGQGNDLPVSAP